MPSSTTLSTPLSVVMPSSTTQWPFSNRIVPVENVAVSPDTTCVCTTLVPAVPAAPSLTSSKSFVLWMPEKFSVSAAVVPS